MNLKEGRNELSLLLEQNLKSVENSIISYILKLKNEGYAYASINLSLAAITHFYVMKCIVINRKKIGKYLGEHIKTIKDRAYTIEEIKKIVDCCGSQIQSYCNDNGFDWFPYRCCLTNKLRCPILSLLILQQF